MLKSIEIKKVAKWLRCALKNYDKPLPIYQVDKTNGIKVHVGCGKINIQGWINIDAVNDDHIHVNTTNLDLKEFSDGSVSEIYMCHVLEHFSFNDGKNVLIALNKKLCDNGIIRISVPDFDKIIEIYVESNRDLDLVKHALMGGQGYAYNFHKAVYNKKSLLKLMEESGYDKIQDWDTIKDFGINLEDWSSEKYKIARKEFPISLNVKGKKNTFDGS